MKHITALGSALIALALSASPAFAQGGAGGTGSSGGPALSTCGSAFGTLCLDASDIGTTVNSLLNFAYVIAILIALAYLVYGGIRWITSGGDKTAVETARNQITSALLGLVIIFLSYFILNVVLNFFLHTGLQNIVLPQL